MSRHYFVLAAIFIVAIALAAGGSPALARNDATGKSWDNQESAPAVEIHGFAESSGSARLVGDATTSRDYPLGKARLRLDIAHYADRAEATLKLDFVRDAITREDVFSIRRAIVGAHVATWLDVRAGRQVLTWGTGDLLFLNDLFPKDFQSFFTGEDDEFLKAPADAIKLSGYFGAFNVDVVWSPTFEPDRYIDGTKLSFFSPSAGRRVSAETMGNAVHAITPDQTLENSEVYVRFYRTVGSAEVALYGYRGFTKEPVAFHQAAGLPTFSRRNSGGASLRGNLLGGIASIEGAYYDSENDRNGTNPFIPNSQVRGVVGYEKEIVKEFTVGLQYYAELTTDYDSLLAHSPWPAWEPDEVRQLVTGRVSWWLKQQTLLLSAFGFISPNAGDSHWRFSTSLKWSDNVTFVLGSNLMFGNQWTFFGQLHNNSNAYLRLRYAF